MSKSDLVNSRDQSFLAFSNNNKDYSFLAFLKNNKDYSYFFIRMPNYNCIREAFKIEKKSVIIIILFFLSILKASLTFIFIFLVLNNLHLCLINKYKHINILGIKQESCQYFEKISSILLSLDLLRYFPPPYNRRKESSWCSYYIVGTRRQGDNRQKSSVSDQLSARLKR